MKKGFLILIVMCMMVPFIFGNSGCDLPETKQVESDTGVKKVTAEVKVQASGETVEQENVRRRLEMENEPGSIKHLYVISAMSGQVVLYSTVKGKVTSSGKRLSPKFLSGSGQYYRDGNYKIVINGEEKWTRETLGDDGTYGSSIEYLYWWDVQDRYHQHYVSGGQIIHVSNQPIKAKNIILNLETTQSGGE